MDDTLKRRLLGAAILLATAFILAALLPEPKLQAPGDEDIKVVNVDLQAPAATPAVIRPTPVEVIDPTVAAPDSDSDYSSNEAAAPEIAETDDPVASGEPPVATPAPTVPPTARPTARPTTIATPTARPTLAPTPKPTQAPTATPKPTLAPTAPVAAAPAAAAQGDRWWVQIGSYSNITNAREGETRLKALGIPVFIAPIDSPNGILYRVRGGPYADKANGEKALAAVLKDGFKDARLVHP